MVGGLSNLPKNPVRPEEGLANLRARRILVWHERPGKFRLKVVDGKNLTDEQYLRQLHKMADKFEADVCCYFIGGDTGPVKIGMGRNLQKRFLAIQACSPILLKVLAVTNGGQSRETAYHYTFRAHRLHGEWFERCPEIQAEIDRLPSQEPSP